MKFTKIPTNTFKNIVMNAGVVLKNFDASTGTYEDDDILGATSGGVNFTAVPSFTDYGEDIDNCPKNMKELKKLESWEVKLSGSFVTVSLEMAKLLAAAADSDASSNKITPRNEISSADFNDLWLVCDYSDQNGAKNGGLVAVKVLNALSTGGFAIQSTDKAKGKFAFEFTGHVSMDAQDVVPFEVYVKAGTAET